VLNLQITQLISQALRLDPESFSFLLADPDLLFHQDASLDRYIQFRLQIVHAARRVPCLAFIIVVRDLDISEFQG
jgi:hypothetical protein